MKLFRLRREDALGLHDDTGEMDGSPQLIVNAEVMSMMRDGNAVAASFGRMHGYRSRPMAGERIAPDVACIMRPKGHL